MFDYNNLEQLNIHYTNLVSRGVEDEKFKNVFEIFLDEVSVFKYDNKFEKEQKYNNIVLLTLYNIFTINELLSNILLKNYISIFSLTRVLIENYYYLYFLKNSSEKINEVYYDYNQLKFINIWDEEKIKMYEEKYSVKINRRKDKQWIEQIRDSKNANGFNYIKEKVENLGETFYYDWYKSNSNFIHSSLPASKLNISLFLDDDNKYKQFIDDILHFLVNDIHKVFLINEDYLLFDEDNIEKRKLLIEKIINFYGRSDK